MHNFRLSSNLVMTINYQIINEEKLLLLKFSGQWSIDDYKNSLEKFVQIENFEMINKVLSDFREALYDFSSSQIQELAELREKKIRKKYRHVRIVNNPVSTALAHLYHEELNARGFLDSYCSTVEHAVKLLNLNMNAKEIEKILNNLENKL